MRKWQADAIVWTLWAGLFVAAGVAEAVPRWDSWCLLIGGTSIISSVVFTVVASMRGWVKGYGNDTEE